MNVSVSELCKCPIQETVFKCTHFLFWSITINIVKTIESSSNVNKPKIDDIHLKNTI